MTAGAVSALVGCPVSVMTSVQAFATCVLEIASRVESEGLPAEVAL